MKLTVVCGPMAAGKSTELIRVVRRYQIANRSVALFKPEADTRSQGILTHDGVKIPARPFELDDPSVPWVLDECQFQDGLPEVIRKHQPVEVWAFGLDMDATGKPFGPMGELCAMAQRVVKLTAVCPVCGSDATMTQRLLPWGESAPKRAVGGLQEYEPRCLTHWTPNP